MTGLYGEYARKRVCGNCWQYESADYEERRGKCRRFGWWEYPDAAACERFEDRHAEEFDAVGDAP